MSAPEEVAKMSADYIIETNDLTKEFAVTAVNSMNRGFAVDKFTADRVERCRKNHLLQPAHEVPFAD